MKKNYIAHLQQYEAKTTPTAKLNNYRKKYTKTVYQNDKENQHPNLPSSSQSKKMKKNKSPKAVKSQQASRLNTEKSECGQATDRPRNTLGGGKTINQQNKQQYSELKMRCVRLTRMLRDKQVEEEEKCLTYYFWLSMEIQHQQKQAISFIESAYSAAVKKVQEASVQLDSQYREGSCPEAPKVELELIKVELDEQMRPKIHDQLQQLNILNLNKGELQQSPSQSFKLQCSEELLSELVEHPPKRRTWQLNPLQTVGGFPVVYEATESQEGISPSFKEI